MFEYLSQHPKIIVTGPQRSGTTICAKMIAHDTGYAFVDESDVGVDDLRLLQLVLKVGREFVVQCPALCRHVHEVADEQIAVVLMRRDVREIVASQRRIRWRFEKAELARYGLSEGVISEVKYRYWEEHQRQRIVHAYEIDHRDLAAHPLWIPEELRRNFRPKQTSP